MNGDKRKTEAAGVLGTGFNVLRDIESGIRTR